MSVPRGGNADPLALEAMSRTLLLARGLLAPNRPSDAQLLDALFGTTVLLVADAENLASAAGQHALVALFGQVARLGVSVRLALPEVAVAGHQPPLRGTQLRAALLDLGADLIPGQRAEVGTPDDAVDVALILGDSPWRGAARHAVRLWGGDWHGCIAPADAPVRRWEGAFPMGALAAAGVAAPEVFKFAVRRLARVLPEPVAELFLAPVDTAEVRLAPPGTPTRTFPLGEVDAVSGGAIVGAALFAVLRVPGAEGHIRVIEPETADLSNTNRYALLRRSDRDRLKIDVLAGWSRPGLAVTGLPLRYDSTTRQRVVPLARRVLIGADDVPTRWLAQREWPEWLGVGATEGPAAVVSSHSPAEPCAGCAHPAASAVDGQPIATVSFVSFWAGLLLAVRLLRHAAGHPTPADAQQEWCAPLRLDQKRAHWLLPVARLAACPLGCSARSHRPTGEVGAEESGNTGFPTPARPLP